jgi:hypothetical protein
MKKLSTNLSHFYIQLATVLLVGCNGYPLHKVCEGDETMIVYKAETKSDAKWGKYRYAITDKTGRDGLMKTNSKLNVGDTIYVFLNSC